MRHILLAAAAAAVILAIFFLKRKKREGLAFTQRMVDSNLEPIAPPETDDQSILRLRFNEGNVTVVHPSPHGRAQGVLNFMKQVAKKYPNIRGDFPIGLEDLYAGESGRGRLVFSKNRGDPGILIPDLYAMGNYDGKIDEAINDNRKWKDKKDAALFIGTITGDFDPKKNQRLQLCRQAHLHPDDLECYVVGSQIPADDIRPVYPEYDAHLRLPMNQQEQLGYRYLVSVDGNTAAWDRPLWIMASDSLLIKVRGPGVCWYYPLMEELRPYIEAATVEDVPRALAKARAMPAAEREEMQLRAKDFVLRVCNLDSHIEYTGRLLTKLSH